MEIEKKINIKIGYQESQQIIVNGIPYTEKQTIIQMSCPECNSVITTIPVEKELNLLEINKWLISNEANLNEKLCKYCPHCGQKLSYHQEEIISI